MSRNTQSDSFLKELVIAKTAKYIWAISTTGEINLA